MFNNKLRKNSIYELNKSVDRYDLLVDKVRVKATNLHVLRSNSGLKIIQPVEDYINSLANSPKEFDKSFSIYKAEFNSFNKLVGSFEAESIDTDFKAGSTAAAGVAAGVGTAALMPSAAMAIATTFGTASTGTAIASLSGAAATNAALAWLGGGALSAGGAGIAGGNALLALAGPIGMGIAAFGLIGGGLLANSKNKKIASEANTKRKEIETGISVLKVSELEINELYVLTNKHQIGVINLLIDMEKSAPKDYKDFRDEQKRKLGSIINHLNSLSQLLNKKV